VSTLADILTEMADQIRTHVVTVTDVDVQVEDRIVVNPTPPTIDMWPGTPSNDPEPRGFSAAGLEEGELVTIRARVDANDNVANQDLLLALMDPEDDLCLVQALYDEPTLNGTATDVNLESRTGFLPVLDGSGVVAMISCEWTFMVIRAQS